VEASISTHTKAGRAIKSIEAELAESSVARISLEEECEAFGVIVKPDEVIAEVGDYMRQMLRFMAENRQHSVAFGAAGSGRGLVNVSSRRRSGLPTVGSTGDHHLCSLTSKSSAYQFGPAD